MPRVITPTIIADFRNRLCDVAAELLVEQGMDGFNMRELAKRLRVSPMTAYRYFKDKNEILAQLRSRGFARLADVLDDAQERFPNEAASVVRAYIRFALEEPITYRLMFDLFQPSGQEPADLARHECRVRDAICDLAVEIADAPAADGQRMGDVLWSALHGVVALHLSGKLDAASFQRSLAAAMRVFANASLELQLLQPGWLDVTAADAGPAALSAAE